MSTFLIIFFDDVMLCYVGYLPFLIINLKNLYLSIANILQNQDLLIIFMFDSERYSIKIWQFFFLIQEAGSIFCFNPIGKKVA